MPDGIHDTHDPEPAHGDHMYPWGRTCRRCLRVVVAFGDRNYPPDHPLHDDQVTILGIRPCQPAPQPAGEPTGTS